MDKQRNIDDEALELDEKHVADAIDQSIHHPSSIEEEALLEAAELEELKFPHRDA